MAFASLAFIFVFLPISIIVYHSSPNRYKNMVLLVISLVFYSLLEPKNILLLIASIGYDYSMSYAMKYAGQDMKKRMIPLVASIVKNVGLIIYTYIMFTLGEINLPVGIAVYTLTAMGYIIDIYEGEIPYEDNIVDFGLFCCFFGKIFVGPLVQYKQSSMYIKNKHISISDICEGIITFTYGVSKQVIITTTMFKMHNDIKQIAPENTTILSSWLLIMGLAFMVYYNLSGFCDMARGLAKIYCLNLPRNFYYPYQARNIQDFVSRFNKTYSEYIERYVFKKLGGTENNKIRVVINIILTSILYGMWFGISFNVVLWGVYFGVFIIFEHFFLNKIFKKLPTIICRFYTFFVVLISFTIFDCSSFSEFLTNFTSLFKFGQLPIHNEQIIYILISNYAILAVGILFITNIPSKISKKMLNNFPRISRVIMSLVNIILLILTTSFLV